MTSYTAFEPSLTPQFTLSAYPKLAGLQIYVQPGVITNAGVTSTYAGGYVPVTALAVTYVYFDLIAQTIGTNTSGFTPNNFPIAVVSANATQTTGLTDVRPDIFIAGAGAAVTDGVRSVSVTGTITFGSSTNLLVKATAGVSGITITLPSAVGAQGQKICLKKVDTGAGSVTVATVSAQTIDGVSTFVIFNLYEYVTVESDNANWFVVANNA